MDVFSYFIYIIFFVTGSIIGLVFSYSKHGEPFIINKIDYISLIISIIGWFLLINSALITLNYLVNLILISLGLLMIGFVIGMRPGYGRFETFIGIAISVTIWILTNVI